MLEVLSWSELKDWLALYEIDPWDESRKDVRAAVQSLWSRGAKFDELDLVYPHVPLSDNLMASDEDDEEIIAAIREMNRIEQDATAGTAEPETNWIG